MTFSADIHEVPGAETAEVVEDDSLHTSGPTRTPFVLFPLLCGVLVLALDIFLLSQFKTYFFAKTLQGGVSLALALASGITCLLLIAYAFGVGRLARGGFGGHQRGLSAFTTWVVVPLLLGAVALAATIGGMEMNRAATERQPLKSCIDLIEQAAGIAKENPQFRLPAKDSNEVRCSINASIGR